MFVARATNMATNKAIMNKNIGQRFAGAKIGRTE